MHQIANVQVSLALKTDKKKDCRIFQLPETRRSKVFELSTPTANDELISIVESSSTCNKFLLFWISPLRGTVALSDHRNIH
jgi:hypothetical protein